LDEVFDRGHEPLHVGDEVQNGGPVKTENAS
jgi:hypothetical protein